MEIDDSEEKLRRNLLVFSSAILGTAFLQPKLAQSGIILGFIQTKDVDPFRMWVAVTAILMYLTYRYWYSGARSKAWVTWHGAASFWANQPLSAILQEAIRATYMGEDRGYPLAGAKPFAEHARREITSIDVYFESNTDFRRSGLATYTADFVTGYGVGSQAVNYDIGKGRGIWLYANGLGRTLGSTGSLGEIVVPLAVTLLAFVVCVSALWDRWPWVFVKPW